MPLNPIMSVVPCRYDHKLIDGLVDMRALPPDCNPEQLRSPAQTKLSPDQGNAAFLDTLILADGDVMLLACEGVVKDMGRGGKQVAWGPAQVDAAKKRISAVMETYYKGGTVAFDLPLYSDGGPDDCQQWVDGEIPHALFKDAYSFLDATRVRFGL
jgi:hypothetical protein